MRSFYYVAPGDYSKVVGYYQATLSRNGWKLIDGPDGGPGYRTYYQWTDPGDRSPWHLQIDLYIVSEDGDHTGVNMEYGRYPDAFKNLPLYPDAADVRISCDGGSWLDSLSTTYRTVRKSYLTAAKPATVTTFYTRTMPQYGWWDMSSGNELHFRGRASYTSKGFAQIPDLRIAVSSQDDGSTQVQLSVGVSQHGPLPATDQPIR